MIFPLMLLACASVPGLQENTTTQTHDKLGRLEPVHRFVSLEEMMGSKVQLAPSMEERVEAMEDGEKPEHPTCTVEDLVLTEDGRITFAALSVGGILGIADKTVLVPTHKLRHVKVGDDSFVCRLSMTKAELEAQRPFDVAMAKEDGRLEGMVRTVEASYGAQRDGQAPTRELLFASTLCELKLRGSDGAFGSVSDAVVDLQSHQIPQLIVSRGGAMGIGDTLYLIPMRAAKVAAYQQKGVLMVERPVAKLEQCVRYEKPDEGFVALASLKRSDADFDIKRMTDPKMDKKPIDKKPMDKKPRR